MSSDPDVIRADIEATRANLSNDVNALADGVSPKAIARRQKEKVTGRLGSVKDKVMGGASDTTSAVSSAGSTIVAAGTPGQVKAQTQGSPLAAGLIAFGAGALIAALIPVSDKERQAAAEIQDRAEPLKDEVTAIAKDAAQNLKEPAQQAVSDLKDTATDAVTSVQQEGQSAVEDVKSDAQDAKTAVQEHHSTA
jgi:gas vesicle protein